MFDCIQSSEGIVFVHIPYKKHAKTFGMMLEEGGYDRYGHKNFIDSTTARNGKQYLYLTGDTADTSKKFLNESISRLNAVKNNDGSDIKVVIATDVAKEGLNFFNVREIHILSPWFHLNRLEQYIGRGMRNCSHKNLEDALRNVTIYYHAATVPEGFCTNSNGSTVKAPNDFDDRRTWKWGDVTPILKNLQTLLAGHTTVSKMNASDMKKVLMLETYDEYLYWYAVNKAKSLAPIMRMLKKQAFDCNLNSLINVNTKGKYKREKIPKDKQVTTAQGVSFKQELYDEDNSQICDFMECEYKCDNPVKTRRKPNMDTYILRYAKNDIESVKTYIKGLFAEGFVYSLDDIMSYITDINGLKVDDLYIYYALDEFISKGIIIYDRYGRSGRIFYVPKDKNNTYYIFQPFELEDVRTSINIRDKPVSLRDKVRTYTPTRTKTTTNVKTTDETVKTKEPVAKTTIKDSYKAMVEKADIVSYKLKDINFSEHIKDSIRKVNRYDLLVDITGCTKTQFDKLIDFKRYNESTPTELLNALRSGETHVREFLKPLTYVSDKHGSTLYALPNYSTKKVELYVEEDSVIEKADTNEPIVKDIRKRNSTFDVSGSNITFKNVKDDSKFGFTYKGVKHPRDKNIIQLSAYGYMDKRFYKETVLGLPYNRAYWTRLENKGGIKADDVRASLKGSQCKSNRDKKKLTDMLIAMSGDDDSIVKFGKPSKKYSENKENLVTEKNAAIKAKLKAKIEADEKKGFDKIHKVMVWNKRLYIKDNEIKVDKDKICQLIQLVSLYNRVIKGELHYKYRYEMESYTIDGSTDI